MTQSAELQKAHTALTPAERKVERLTTEMRDAASAVAAEVDKQRQDIAEKTAERNMAADMLVCGLRGAAAIGCHAGLVDVC